ncbi:MAG: hypothetical protein ABR584_11575 [Candidatus Baltobacteraceae bacterium]
MLYQNTRVGVASLGVCVPLIGLFLWLRLVTHSGPLDAFAPLVILVALAIVFSSLTVRITATGIEWWLGLGLLRRSRRFEEIAAAKTREIFPLAFGIHWDLRGGISYIVTGGSALELLLKNGKRVTISCNEPQKIIALLEQHGVRPAG